MYKSTKLFHTLVEGMERALERRFKKGTIDDLIEKNDG